MCVQYMKSRMIIECNPWTGGLGHWDSELNARLRIPSPFLSCCKLCFASRQLSRWQAYVYPLACGWMLPTSLPEITWQGKKRIKRVFNSYIYIYIIRLLIKIPLSRNGHSSRIKILLSRNFRELHVYLSRGPCWPTTPLMKIRSPPAKLRQRITDHFLVAF